MKKIVALVLSLVMVLGLATTAFAATKVPQWITNATEGFDVFDGNNVKCNETEVGVEIVYHPAVKPAAKNDFVGNITYYTLAEGSSVDVFDLEETYDDETLFVLVKTYEEGCIALKAHTDKIEQGEDYDDVDAQTVPTAVYYLKPVPAVHYNFDGKLFTDWGTKCGDIAEPESFDEEADYARVTDTAWGKTDFDFITALGAAEDADDDAATTHEDEINILVDGVVYTAGWGDNVVDLTVKHTWVASEFDEEDGDVTKYICSNCKVVGTAVASPFLAPADASIEQLDNLSYVYFYTTATDDGETVESAKTFDAGIAMYVGMSVMAAAGSAVVLKKKD